ncbi:amidohydrolase family protein [Variovorax sp. J22P271]|nr:amidohydrolase family protein [Variovorax sp. J22P271]MDM0037295.1 amidohydrolase family protein [Variovorax sp. J22P271]
MNWLHFCGRGGSPRCPAGGERSTGGPGPAGLFAVDVHCHVTTLPAEALVASHPMKLAEPAAMREAMGDASVAHNLKTMLPHAFPRLTQVTQRLADMDAMGVDVQVISPSPHQYYYWAEPELARELVRVQNEGIAALCAQHPAQLRGLGTVALQHPETAVEQLEYAVRILGLEGVEISTSVEGRELDDPSLEPFWAAAASLDAVVFIHPFGTTLGARVATHYLNNTIGQPLETTIALSRSSSAGCWIGTRACACWRRTAVATCRRTWDARSTRMRYGRRRRRWRASRPSICARCTSTPSSTTAMHCATSLTSLGSRRCCWGPTILSTWGTTRRTNSSRPLGERPNAPPFWAATRGGCSICFEVDVAGRRRIQESESLVPRRCKACG